MKIFVRDFEYTFDRKELLYEWGSPYVNCMNLLNLNSIVKQLENFNDNIIIHATTDKDENLAFEFIDERLFP